MLQGDRGWFERTRAQIVWDTHVDDRDAAATAAAAAHPQLVGERVALSEWLESVSCEHLADRKDPLLGGTTPTLPSLLLRHTTFRHVVCMYTQACAYSHNVPRRLKKEENGASTLNGTQIKNSFTLKLTDQKFQNHTHTVGKKKKGITQQLLGTQCSYFVYLSICQDHYLCQGRDVPLLPTYDTPFSVTECFSLEHRPRLLESEVQTTAVFCLLL